MKGATVIENSFTSTSAFPSKAFSGDTVFIIESVNGKDVSKISEYGSEKEVLFPPKTQFKVIDVEVDPKSRVRRITMYEIPKNGGEK